MYPKTEPPIRDVSFFSPVCHSKRRAELHGSNESRSGNRTRWSRRLRIRHDHGPRQWPRGREHGQKCDQLPGGRDIENPEHREYIAEVWGVPEDSIPRKGLTFVPILEAIHAGKIKGMLSICCNPMVSLPNSSWVREALEKLELYSTIDFCYIRG
jgi:hypothetical protein